ncbi:MAG: dTMP kinase [Anaerovoracaceae bacterium]|jgi:dTMP kinase
MRDKGLFITIEGPDGSGKSTQLKKLCSFLKKRRADFVFTREPGGTAVGERIREIVLDKNHPEMDDLTEAMLYAAQRTQHVREMILPALKEGKIVICDRFVDSSLVYQGYARGLGEDVKTINDMAIKGAVPDITFLIMVDPETGRRRMKERDMDRLEQLAEDFHERVYEGYMKLAEKEPNRFFIVDGSLSPNEVFEKIKEKLVKLLGEAGI